MSLLWIYKVLISLKKNKKKFNNNPGIEDVYFSCNTGECKATLILLNSEESIEGDNAKEEENLNLLGTACNKKEYDPDSALCGVVYTVGASEYLEGINFDDDSKFKDLREAVISNEEEIKEEWGFPLIKEFRIVMYSNWASTTFNSVEEGSTNEEYVIGTQVPPLSEEVYVREFNTVLLTNDGEEIPVTINIRVW